MFFYQAVMQQRRGVRRRGMTLVELMIVVVIIGIIFAYAITNSTTQVEKAKYSKAEEDLQLLASALSLSYVTNGGDWTPKSGQITSGVNDYAWSDLFSSGENISQHVNSKLTKSLSQIADPWGRPYDIIMEVDGANATCYILCRPDASGATTYANARHNKYSIDKAKMARVVVFKER